jgi:Protein of unknown function (DUF3102)
MASLLHVAARVYGGRVDAERSTCYGRSPPAVAEAVMSTALTLESSEPVPAPTRGARRPRRSLAEIEAALAGELQRERMSVITIGELLIAAKGNAELAHGEWLPWLEKHFGASRRCAQRYMKAAKWAAKNATVAHLKLKPGAIYWLMQPKWFVREVETEIFALAETRWVDEEDCEAFLKEFRKALPPQMREVAAAQEKRRTMEENICRVVSNDLTTEFGMQAFKNSLATLPDERLTILRDAINDVIEERKQHPSRFNHHAPDF